MNIAQTQIAYHTFNINNNNINLNVVFIQQILNTILQVNLERPPIAPQKALSDAIVFAFNDHIPGFSSTRADLLCHLGLNYQYDGMITIGQNRIGIEIQFRPDFLKDITRFQIGFHANRFQAIVYIVSIDRRTIQPNSSMPQFASVNRHIQLLNWLNIPIIVIGVNCIG